MMERRLHGLRSFALKKRLNVKALCNWTRGNRAVAKTMAQAGQRAQSNNLALRGWVIVVLLDRKQELVEKGRAHHSAALMRLLPHAA